ncbi:MAG: TolC family protein [Candidatus Omnitrophica bacterium]|nr:TolC family protein [Candidatus Omnitrophota bacterium]
MKIERGIIFFIPVFLAVFSGCSGKYLEKSADRQVHEIIEEKKASMQDDVLPETSLAHISDSVSSETIRLELKDAIILASKNNRTYKSNRESVYLNILDLTYQRYLFGNRYGLGGDVSWSKNGDENISGGLGFNLIRWLSTGAQITFDIAKDFVRYLTGDADTDIGTIVAMNILQPLLKGAGREIAQEDLIQAERDAVYGIRSFLRYRKNFSIDTTEKFLQILLTKNRTDNYYNNYNSLKITRERIEMLAEAGRLPPFQVDQARQNEYAAYQRWINAQNSYVSALDNFKIFLGIPMESVVSPDETLLERLVEAGITEPDIDVNEFIGNAVKKRLDLLTDYDRVEDSKRQIKIALNNLKPRVDLIMNVTASTDEEDHPTVDFRNFSYRAGVEFDLPLSKLPERNSYKRALISLNSAQRNFENKRDTVILDVFQQSRNLEEYYQSYVIQKNSLLLAGKRIESTDLLLQAGRATTRDLLDAEESYLSAKNDLASAVVNYIVSYLKFLYSSEYLEVDDEGMWKGELYENITKENTEK